MSESYLKAESYDDGKKKSFEIPNPIVIKLRDTQRAIRGRFRKRSSAFCQNANIKVRGSDPRTKK